MDLFLQDGNCEILECPAILDPEELTNTKKLRSCIDCYSCLSACPVLKVMMNLQAPISCDIFPNLHWIQEIVLIGLRTALKKVFTAAHLVLNVWKSAQRNKHFGGAIEKLREIACQEGIGPLPTTSFSQGTY